MSKTSKNITLGFFAAGFLALLPAASAFARPVWQEKEQEDQVKRIRIEKRPQVRVSGSPCVFITSSHRRGMLGVQLTNLTPDLRSHFGAPKNAGVMVSGVTADSPAEKAGIRVGDIITAIDGEDASSSSDVARRIRRKEDGETAEIQILRDGSSLELNATIEERERSEVDLGNLFLEDCDEFEFDFDFDEEAVREAIENATRHLRSPEWKSQWKSIERITEEEVEAKLKELEKKLEKMEKELEKLEEKKRNKNEKY
jgi:hypothetical protein